MPYSQIPQTEDTFLALKMLNGVLQGVWRNLEASDLGSGSTGEGSLVLHDDMTWARPSPCNTMSMDCGSAGVRTSYLDIDLNQLFPICFDGNL